jgi:5-methylcytosine-specific restriction endonuclease McrA
VTKILPKSPRLKLDSESYTALHQQVLERDNWRCQACGSMRNLEVHHIQFRSHFGPDIEQNLVTLCAACHGQSHKQWRR